MKKFTVTITWVLCLLSQTAYSELFKNNNHFPQINEIREVLSGDINGDQLPDLVVVSEHSAGILIFLNQPTNTFELSENQLNTGLAKDALLEDFDGDGDLDIWAGLTSSEFEDLDALYLNDGQGQFTYVDLDVTQNIFFTGTDQLLSGDLDNNGSIDVIRVLRRSIVDPVGIFVFKNDGNASFEEFELPIAFGKTELADFNGDGFLDIWSMDNGLDIFLNDGGGLFSNELKIETDVVFGNIDSLPINPILADIDQDGDVDIQVFDTEYALPRYLNNGDGTFSIPSVAVYFGSPGIQNGVFLDVDDDSDLDLWYGSDRLINSEIIKTNSQGGVDYSATRIDVIDNRVDDMVVDDFDHDGDLDVVSIGALGIQLWLQAAPDQFNVVAQPEISQSLGYSDLIAMSDMNGDGHNDLVLAGNDGIKVALKQGKLGFGKLTKWGDAVVRRFHVADINTDGFADMVFTDNSSQVGLLTNNQNSGFIFEPLNFGSQLAYAIKSGDIDGDGDLDLVVQEFLGSIHVLLNQGQNGFELQQSILGAFRSIDLLDLNADGTLQLIAVNSFDFFGETTVGVIEYVYHGAGFVKSREVAFDGFHSNYLIFNDFDEDGDLDIITTEGSQGQYIWLENQEDAFAMNQYLFANGIPLQMADLDLNGSQDIITNTGEVWLKQASGYVDSGIDYEFGSRRSFLLEDIDSDSDLDLVYIEDQLGVSTAVNLTEDIDFSGSWYAPSQDGHGLQVEEISQNGFQSVVVSWYVFHNGNPIWLIGTGDVVNNSARANLFITSGPDFGTGYDLNDLSVERWGSVELTISEPNVMQFLWHPEQAEFSDGNLQMQRFVTVKENSKSLTGIKSCHSGSWYDPQTDGQGLMVQVIESNGESQVLLTWYTYADGQQYWITAIGPIHGNKAVLQAFAATGGVFPPAFSSEAVDFFDWGEVEFKVIDDGLAKVMWQPNVNGFAAGESEVIKLSGLDRYNCH